MVEKFPTSVDRAIYRRMIKHVRRSFQGNRSKLVATAITLLCDLLDAEACSEYDCEIAGKRFIVKPAPPSKTKRF